MTDDDGQMTHENAQDRTHSPDQGSRALPDATDAGEALVQQIAEAMHRSSCGGPDYRECVDKHLAWERWARAVLPLVEAQVAPLRDEVAHWEHHAWEAGEGFKRAVEDMVRIAVARREAVERAMAAESALRQVRELAESWPRYHSDRSDYGRAVNQCRAAILAILDSARVGAADTQPEGAQVRPRAIGFCPRCGNVVGLMHTLPECNAMYDRKYRATAGVWLSSPSQGKAGPAGSPSADAAPEADDPMVAIVRREAAQMGVRRDLTTPEAEDVWCLCGHLAEHHDPEDAACRSSDPGAGWACDCEEFVYESPADTAPESGEGR